MRTSYEKLDAKWKRNGRLSQNERLNYSIYFCTWLGYLGVACESFRDLNLRLLLQKFRPAEFCELVPVVDAIGSKIKKHCDSLRKFRNSVFHLRSDAVDMNSFLSQTERLEWAKELHEDFKGFFSSYRVMCFVHYVTNERLDETAGWLDKRKKAAARSDKP
ncbi:hypothetical protein [Variovorax sp. CCNWLW235]|uniref:hypothetical protein n=1 Tax=Variovorax sp. CCNWLW235 TaxID=3127463 RepID=UPI003076EB79